MHNQMKGNLNQNVKSKDESFFDQLTKYVARSRGRANNRLHVQIRADASLLPRIH
jgi:hypothetical protein